jgi:hypothetical protein
MKKTLLLIILLISLSGCNKNTAEIHDPIIDGLIIEQEITSNLIVLPNVFEQINLSWYSSHPDIISPTGNVSRVYTDQVVILKASYTINQVEYEKTFEVIVKATPLTTLEKLNLDLENLNIPNEVVEDLVFPSEGLHGSRILWVSSKPHIMSSQGKYYQPIDDEPFTLKAILILENTQITHDFDILAKGFTDEQKVTKDQAMLHIETKNIEGDIFLPKRGYFTSDISWVSSHPNIISNEGKLILPIGNQTVTLTATIYKGDYTMSKTFDIIVEGYTEQTFFEKVDKKLSINHGIEVIFDDLILPTSILDIATITWESSHPEIISPNGKFLMPDQSTTVTLTAHVQSGSYEKLYHFSYMIYGLNDDTSTQQNNPQSLINVDTDDLFYVDSKSSLLYGEFENIMFKDQHLVLSKDALIGTYTSPILNLNNPVSKLYSMWGSITHKNAKTELFTRYETDHGWSNWFSHGIWGYGGENQPPVITRYLPNVSHFQYKVELTRSSKEVSSPHLTYISFQFLAQTPVTYDISKLNSSVLYDVPQLKQASTSDPFLWPNICWATSISMLLQYYDQLTDLDVPHEYYSVLIRQGTERFGTPKNDIGSTQFNVYLHELEFSSSDMLLHVIDHYGPLLVGVSKGDSPTGAFGPISFSSGHVVVVVGYHIHEDGSVDIIINDPAVQSMTHPITGSLEEFMLVWDKGGALMLPM